MNILCDFHHSDLWWSHHLIFEVALGHKLYRPRGMEWFERGYYPQQSKDVAEQFLVNSLFELNRANDSVLKRLPTEGAAGVRGSMDTIIGGCPYYPLIRTLSLEEFADTPIDAIMATVSDIQEPWLRLRAELKLSAKLIREEGNVNGWASLHPEYKNLLTSDLPTFQNAQLTNKVLYHQRFDTESVFKYSEPSEFDTITCFMPGFRGTPALVEFAESHHFGEMKFIDYGHYSKRGFLSTKTLFSEALRKTAFVWHVKPGGDGFGHVIHNSFAMGRPVITIYEDYQHSQIWPLLLDEKNCILIGRDPKANSKKIMALAEPGRIVEMSRNAAARFRQVIDYQWETDRIKTMLERLQ